MLKNNNFKSPSPVNDFLTFLLDLEKVSEDIFSWFDTSSWEYWSLRFFIFWRMKKSLNNVENGWNCGLKLKTICHEEIIVIVMINSWQGIGG